MVEVALSSNTPLKFINFSAILRIDCNISSGIYFGIRALET